MPHTPAFSPHVLKTHAPPLFVMARAVRFQDVDAAGTVFFPRVLEYFSDAYLAFLDARGIDLPGDLARGEGRAPLAHAEADYLAPLHFGSAIAVEIVGARLGGTSFTLGYRITARHDEGRTLYAVGQTVHVFVDGQTFKPCAIPAEFRGALAPPAGNPEGTAL